MVTQIKKRNGAIVPFDPMKIRNAISKANLAVEDEVIEDAALNVLTRLIVNKFSPETIPTVEEIQDTVEENLILAEYAKTAKAYILYRAEHARIRQAESDLMDIYQQLTFRNAQDVDLKRENANIDADTAMGTMLKYGSEGSKYFTNNYVLPKEFASAHINGDIHIHDQDFYMLTETCCQIDLLKLFKGGFSTGHGKLREPNDIISYASLACIAIQANQNEMHGGQSIPNFDYSLAPGVAKTFKKSYRDEFSRYVAAVHLQDRADTNTRIADTSTRIAETKKLIAETRALIEDAYAEIGAITMGGEGGFGRKIQSYLAEHAPSLSEDEVAKAHDFAVAGALQETDRKTYQAMEALVHNLNTMNSRAGAQVPFSSVNYGTDTSAEGRMVVKNLLLATEAGLGDGETAIFPVQIFKVKEGVNYNEGDPNYDLFQLSMKVSAKRLFPNFSFLDAPFNLQYYKPGDYDSEVAYMGCRTRVMGNVHDKGRETTSGRGNLSFSSINLPRLGIEAKADLSHFYSLLDDKIDLLIRQLLHRFGIQSSKKVYNYPFLMGQGIWIDSDGLKPDDSIAEVLKHGTLSIGFIGLAETLVALTGKHHGESAESQRLGLEIISHMRQRMDDESAKTGLNFTLLATPAEGLSGRFVAIDKKKYGVIPGVTDREYYTNSFHIPVYFPIKAYKKIQLEAPYHALTNAGHISYVELDGDPSKNLAAFEAVIRCMKESGIGYGSVNHPVDRDPVCGYNGIIDNECPKCGRTEGTYAAGHGADGQCADGHGVDGHGVGGYSAGGRIAGGHPAPKFERIRRITGYLVGTTDRWNNAKRAEEHDRVKHGQ